MTPRPFGPVEGSCGAGSRGRGVQFLGVFESGRDPKEVDFRLKTSQDMSPPWNRGLDRLMWLPCDVFVQYWALSKLCSSCQAAEFTPPYIASVDSPEKETLNVANPPHDMIYKIPTSTSLGVYTTTWMPKSDPKKTHLKEIKKETTVS